MLLERGADVNAQDVYKSTPLHLASEGGRVESARILIDHGADVNARNQWGWTPFQVTDEREFQALLLAHVGTDLENDTSISVASKIVSWYQSD